jgi:hypothetical protein
MLRAWTWLRLTLRDDRGEGPIPYVIMVTIITVAAVAIGGALVAIANGWVAKIPR